MRWMLGLCLVGLLLAAVSPAPARAWVLNQSDHVIWIKPESSAVPVAIAPGERYGAATQDGVAAPHLAAKRVYKTVDHCSAAVGNAGISVRCQGVLATVADRLGYGGWKGEDWLRRLRGSNDGGWHALFKKATVR